MSSVTFQWRHGLILLALTIAVYAGVASHEFVQLDDPTYITQNPHIANGLTLDGVRWAFTSGYAANWHPLTWISHMIDVSLFGLRPGPPHVVNLLLHAVNVLLLFWWLARWTGRTGPSLFVAALFAVHPMHVESVAWISERKDVLSTACWLLTMTAWTAYRERPDARRYGIAIAFFTAGLMAKPMLVTLPFVLMLTEAWGQGPRAPRNRWALAPFFALAALSCVATVIAQRGGEAVMSLESVSVGLRVENAVVSYVRYAVRMFWPADLIAYYAHPTSIPLWQVAASAALLAAISALAFVVRRGAPYVAVGWFWYLGTLVPVIGLVQVGRQAMADRYTYVPFIGLFIVVAWGAADLAARWRIRATWVAVAAVLVILPCALAARAQVDAWRDDGALWSHAIRVVLGVDERTAALAADDLLADRNLNAILALLETRDDNVPPRFQPASARHYLGLVFARHGQMDDALAAYADAIRLNPAAFDAHTDLALALAGLGRLRDALPHFADAVRLRPDLADTHRNFGLALANAGRIDDAMKEFNEVLRLKPDDDNVRRALAELAKRGKSPASGERER